MNQLGPVLFALDKLAPPGPSRPMKGEMKRYLKLAATRLRVLPRTVDEYVALRRAQLGTESRLRRSAATVGIIGCGRHGRTVASAVRNLPGWEITDLFDIQPEAAEVLRARVCPQATLHSDESSFLRRLERLDVVAVTSTAPSHFRVARN